MTPRVLSVLVLTLGLMASGVLHAQDPIHWNWKAQKVSEKEYEVQFTANIERGWHLYSQTQPEDAIAIPTEILFNKNPLVELKDKVKESGELEKYRDETLDIEAWQYSEKVVFTQKVKVKSSVRTNLSGTIEYQACTDEKCLPPKKIPFSIAIN